MTEPRNVSRFPQEESHGNCCTQSHSSESPCCAASDRNGEFKRFEQMIPNALAFAKDAKAQGKKIAGIFCEYAPRELFFAAGVIPVCMCGGQQSSIPEAEKHLPTNLCPLIKSSFGHSVLHSNPFMEMADLIVGETTCDGKKKMYELLGRERPVHVMELPQIPNRELAYLHWLGEIQHLKNRLEELTGNPITEDALRLAIEQMNEERSLRVEFAYLAAEEPPRVCGREVLLAKSSISLIPCDLVAYRKLIEWAKQRSPERFAGCPRILLTGVPHANGAEKVMNLIEEAGAVVVAQENCTGLKPILENVSLEGDLLENLARKYFNLPCSCLSPNDGRVKMLDQLIEDFQPWGIIDLVWQACHTYNIESDTIREQAESCWELPYLKLETDYSPSDAGQLRVRIEAFLELCTSRNKPVANEESSTIDG